VAGLDLVGSEAEPLSDHAAHEVRGQQAIVSAEHEPRVHVRPRVERPWLLTGRVGLSASALECLGGQLGRNIVVEDRDLVVPVRAAVGLVAGVRPPIAPGFARRRDQPSNENEELDGRPVTDERRREGAERLRDHDELAPVADRLEHGVRVLGQPCCVVLAGQIRRHDVVAHVPELSLHEMPVPADVSGAVDQREGGHRYERVPYRT
jgi:hypothetical protein